MMFGRITFMNALNYPVPTWEVLQRQYEHRVRVTPGPVMVMPQYFPRPVQTEAQGDSPLPALVTGSVLLYALSDNGVVKALALQGVSIGGAAWVNQALN
jgi:hypothetical protein